MSDVAEERKKSASTISDAEIIDPMESELTGWSLVFLFFNIRIIIKTMNLLLLPKVEDLLSVPSLRKRFWIKFKKMPMLRYTVPMYWISSLNNSLKPNMKLSTLQKLELKLSFSYFISVSFSSLFLLAPCTFAITTSLTVSRFILLLKISTWISDYDSSTDMLYSGIVAIVEVYLLVALFIFFAYKDEQFLEKRVNDLCKKEN